jgi:hypothetical protein
MQDLYDKFWLRKGNPCKKLMIAMDNCGRKSNFVEMGYFWTVYFVFYVHSHINMHVTDHSIR